METLMARFKASRNSGRKSSFEDSYSNNENQNKMNENSNTKKDKNTDSFSSDDEKPKQKLDNKGSYLKNQTKKQKKQQPDIENKFFSPYKGQQNSNNGNQEQVAEIKNLKDSYASIKENKNSQLITKTKKQMTYVIDETVYKVMEVFKSSESTTYQEKVTKIRSILDLLLDQYKGSLNQKAETDDQSLQQQLLQNQQTQQILQISQQQQQQAAQGKIKLATTIMTKAETQNKIINDLEAKLLESEKQKLQIKAEKEQLASKIENIQKEIEAGRITQEMFQMVKENTKLLERNNANLLEECAYLKKKNVEQQKIFESQVEELTDVLSAIKQQANVNQSYDLNQ